jgi:uncharacterized protein YmfQ (DUF2313 family)
MATTSVIEQFANSLRRFFPRGKAWALENTNLSKLIEGLAVEFSRVQERLDQMLVERDPRKTSELLTDWESALALPDECSELGAGIEKRRQEIVFKLTNTGGSSRAYFELVAQNLGFDVSVNDFFPFKAGRSRAGDALTNEEWTFWFQVTAPADLSTPFLAGAGRAGDRLLELGNEALECTFEKLKPAHTKVLFVFTS